MRLTYQPPESPASLPRPRSTARQPQGRERCVPQQTGFRWQAYGALIEALSWLHYVVISPLGKSDEGGADWLKQRPPPAPPRPTEARRIWIHAVSAGEAKVAELLRQQLLALDPHL